MERHFADPASQVPAQERPGTARPAAPRTQAVRRVLKRRSYAAQRDLLRAGGGPAVGPGEEADLAKAGFSAPARDLPLRTRMEQAFGRPLGHVKAHVGPEASEASAALGAEAYAYGSEVAFDRANPPVETVAHEVAHVVQQSSRPGASGGEAGVADLEREADRASESASKGAAVTGMSPDRPAVRKKEKLPQGKEGFEKMWAAHPHQFKSDEDIHSPNMPTAELAQEIGFPSNWSTCAIRLSVMLNRLGLTITPAKVKAAGIKRAPYKSTKTHEYLILAASEMWTYLEKHFRKADVVFPAAGKYKNKAEFKKGFTKDIEPIVKARKGIVAFEKIFGYGGTGHVDLFDGLKLSDAPDWYPSMRVHLWYVVVPDEGGGL